VPLISIVDMILIVAGVISMLQRGALIGVFLAMRRGGLKLF
jgi:hypothetical protein